MFVLFGKTITEILEILVSDPSESQVFVVTWEKKKQKYLEGFQCDPGKSVLIAICFPREGFYFFLQVCLRLFQRIYEDILMYMYINYM